MSNALERLHQNFEKCLFSWGRVFTSYAAFLNGAIIDVGNKALAKIDWQERRQAGAIYRTPKSRAFTNSDSQDAQKQQISSGDNNLSTSVGSGRGLGTQTHQESDAPTLRNKHSCSAKLTYTVTEVCKIRKCTCTAHAHAKKGAWQSSTYLAIYNRDIYTMATQCYPTVSSAIDPSESGSEDARCYLIGVIMNKLCNTC
eukprot:1936044-Amphidinium_carterae.1